MRIITKMLVIGGLALIPASALAQSAQDGDFYAPSKTVVQQATPAEIGAAMQGDFYAPEKTTVQHVSPQEQALIRQGDFYAPQTGN